MEKIKAEIKGDTLILSGGRQNPRSISDIGLSLEDIEGITKLVVEDVIFKTTFLEPLKDKITEITFGDRVKLIPFITFSGWNSLEKVNFSPNLKRICAYAFASCGNIENLTLPGGVTVEKSVFSFCDNLKKVKIKGKANIHKEAFLYSKLNFYTVSGIIE